MSKRFGRNQKRELRQQLAITERSLAGLSRTLAQALYFSTAPDGGPYDVRLRVNTRRELMRDSLECVASIKDSHSAFMFTREMVLVSQLGRSELIKEIAERIAQNLLRELERANSGIIYG